MTLQTQQLERTFRYNSVDLIDPGAQYTPEQVRDFYAPTYPEILNAAIEGPEEKDGKLRYTFRRAVGTKGMSGLLHGQSKDMEALLRALSAPKHVKAIQLKVSSEELATVLCTYYPEEGPFEQAALQCAEFMLVRRDAGAGLVALERHRQVSKLGYTAQADDKLADHSLAMAACVYAAPEPVHVYRNPPDHFEDPWPWHPAKDKRGFADPRPPIPASAADYPVADRIKLLAKAGALIAAEIDRLLRLKEKPGG